MLARKPIQDISVIDLVGDIDFREMVRIKDVIGCLIEKDRTKVVLNLKSVDHINYLSIGLLLERLKLLRNLNGDLKLAGMSPFLRDIFKVVGMDRVLFGSDYPQVPGDFIRATANSAFCSTAIGEKDREKIQRANGLRLFPRLAK